MKEAGPMNTDALINMLARGAGPAPRALLARRLVPTLIGGLLLGVLLAVGLLGPVPQALLAEPGPWIKLAYAGALAAAASWWLGRLGQPAAPAKSPARMAALVLLLMAVLGGFTLAAAPEADRMALLMGRTWSRCPFIVAGLSLPTLAGALWVLRGMAPTRLRLAGFAAGLLAGAVGAFSYAFHCPELSPAFIAVWYSAGILLAGGLGAVLGPRLLRW